MEKRFFDARRKIRASRATWHYNEETDEATIQTTQDMTAVIEANKRDFAAVDEQGELERRMASRCQHS
jgi:hypothetical protein